MVFVKYLSPGVVTENSFSFTVIMEAIDPILIKEGES